MNLSVLGMRARLRRIETKSEIEEIAGALGIEESALRELEAGDHSGLGLDEVAALARELECRPAWLLGFDDGEPGTPPKADEQRTLAVSLDGIKVARIEEWVAELVAEKLVARAYSDGLAEITREVKVRVTEAVDREIERHVPAAVEAAMREGWQEYSTYGETKKHTVASRLREIFNKDVGDYNRRAKYIDQLATNVMEAWIKKELQEDVAAARKRFTEAVDVVLRAKLADTLRGALGL